MQTVRTAAAITPSVQEWSNGYRGTEGKKGSGECKQLFKNKFVNLTQFCPHPSQRKRQWKQDLETAAEQTVKELCPNWQSDSNHHAIYRSIQATKAKAIHKSPRQDWLSEKACAWLQSLELALQTPQIHVAGEVVHREKAIKIAHHIFLRGSGKFDSFMKYLVDKRRKHDKTINQLIEWHGSYWTIEHVHHVTVISMFE